MVKNVVKRSGEIEIYDREKILSAITKAFTAVKRQETTAKIEAITDNVENMITTMMMSRHPNSIPAIEEIQDAVENALIEAKETAVAKAYILYRAKHEAMRDAKKLMLNIDSTMDGYLNQDDWRVNENANVNYSLGGLILHNSGTITANYWLKNIYTPEIAEAHRNADFHIHDLSMFSGYCFTGDTSVFCLDGTKPTFKELVAKGIKELWVFARNPKTMRIVPAKAINPRITRKTRELVRVTLCGNNEIECTPDHPFMLKDGTYKKANDLRANDSLSSLYVPFAHYSKYWAMELTKTCSTPLRTPIAQNALLRSKDPAERPVNHRVRRVVRIQLNEAVNVYDLTVPQYANFALGAGVFVHNCAGWSLRQLISEGLGGVADKITSKPANHLSTLMQQAVNFLGCLQNEWAGAQAFSSFDTYIAPFVKADNLSDKEVKQCLQSFVFGVNTPSRWGSQAPFTNITLDWTCPPDLKNKKAIVGGKETDFTYGDCKDEMDRVNQLFIELMLEGDAEGRGFQYPIPTYNITPDFDWDSDNAKLLFEMTARYGTPYFQNFINSDLNPEDVRSMCPLLGTTKVAVRSPTEERVCEIQEIVNAMNRKEYEVWTPKGWVKAKAVQTPMTDVYKITVDNGDTICMGENHLQPTRDNGVVAAKGLSAGMRLPYRGAFEGGQYNYYRISAVENIGPQAGEHLFCFELEDEPHLFALASGLMTHNCRLQLDKRELRKRGGGLFGSDELTGSIGVVTINLPRIGYTASDENDFYQRLEKLMALAKDSLMIKRKLVKRLLEAGLFPYTKRYLHTLDNHFNTIGLVGMNECLQNFLGKDTTIDTEKGRLFSRAVLDFMRNKLADFQEETGELFNLEATPAESTSYRLAKHDKARYPEIITAGVDEPYYTNSTQLPVMLTQDIFDALDLQENLQTAYTGGTVFHAFLGEAIEDWRTCRDLVRTIANNYRIPYFTISPTFSVCQIHGYLKGEHFRCPRCKAEKEQTLKKHIADLEKEREAVLAAG
jgi:ribonucleoside-triphosphate reductase